MLPNFHWIIEGVLAGMAMPGSGMWEPMKDFEELKKRGIGVLVTLLERAIPFDIVMRGGLIPAHIPIDDFGPPTIRQVEEFCALVDRMKSEGKAVAVHCLAGLGRTGTMAAAYLIHDSGLEAGDAMKKIRVIEPGYIQSSEQEGFIHKWAEHVKKKQDKHRA
ncbi:MAG: dual specificity protein phosphatase family protein [Pseudomonadota bacterium]